MGLAYVALGRYDDGRGKPFDRRDAGKPTAEMYCRLGEADLLAGHPQEAAAAARQALPSNRSINPAAPCSSASNWPGGRRER